MADRTHQLTTPDGRQVTIIIRRDKRLTKTSRWTPQTDGSILLRVPHRLTKNEVARLLDQLASQIQTGKPAFRRSDEELVSRADSINRRFFDGKIRYRSIRWVGNMEQRLGSCTNGGATDGDIRISERIKDWPDWVIDYVIAHELVHRLHSSHNKEFWASLNDGYPLAERARGFIQGVSFIKGTGFEEGD